MVQAGRDARVDGVGQRGWACGWREVARRTPPFQYSLQSGRWISRSIVNRMTRQLSGQEWRRQMDCVSNSVAGSGLGLLVLNMFLDCLMSAIRPPILLRA